MLCQIRKTGDSLFRGLGSWRRRRSSAPARLFLLMRSGVRRRPARGAARGGMALVIAGSRRETPSGNAGGLRPIRRPIRLRGGGQAGKPFPRESVQQRHRHAGDGDGQRHEQGHRPEDRPVALCLQHLVGGRSQTPLSAAQDIVQHLLGGGGAENVGADQGAQGDGDHGGHAAAVQRLVDAP